MADDQRAEDMHTREDATADTTAALTDDEMAVLDLLAEASRKFFALPEHHPMDGEEWCHEVHHLQQRVMARAAIRWKPDYFTPMKSRSADA